jgi:hypothetical protein
VKPRVQCGLIGGLKEAGAQETREAAGCGVDGLGQGRCWR